MGPRPVNAKKRSPAASKTTRGVPITARNTPAKRPRAAIRRPAEIDSNAPRVPNKTCKTANASDVGKPGRRPDSPINTQARTAIPISSAPIACAPLSPTNPCLPSSAASSTSGIPNVAAKHTFVANEAEPSASTRWIVRKLKPDAKASCSWLQPRSRRRRRTTAAEIFIPCSTTHLRLAITQIEACQSCCSECYDS